MITTRSSWDMASYAASFANGAGMKIIDAFISCSSFASDIEL